MSDSRNHRRRRKKKRNPNINNCNNKDYDNWNSPSLTSEELTHGKGSLKSRPSPDNCKNTEGHSGISRPDNSINSGGWRNRPRDWRESAISRRSTPDDNKNTEGHSGRFAECPSDWRESAKYSKRSPPDDSKNTERRSEISRPDNSINSGGWRNHPTNWREYAISRRSPPDDNKNTEGHSGKSNPDNLKNSEGWRSPPEDVGNSAKTSWRSPPGDSKNAEARSERSRPDNLKSSGGWRSAPEDWVNFAKCSWRSPHVDSKNTEGSSETSRPDNLKNSEGWRSSPEEGAKMYSWRAPADDRENSEKCSSKSTTENNSAFSDDFRPIEKLKNINESGDFENTFDQSQSEVSQEADSENEKDIMNKVSNINFSKEIDTIYDTSSNLSSDFLSALQKNSFTDVSIKCGDYVQQVHKFVLAARSPVFEAMFTTPMEESEKGVVTISDIDASVLDDLLAFIYGAQVKNITLTKACDLLYVAEKYQVKGLKDICTNYLRSCLSIPNAIQILQFADLYDEEFKKDVLNYVCENFSALKTTEEWKTLQTQKPSLSIEVYSVVVEKHEELLGSKNSSSPMETPSSIVKTDSWP